MHHGNCATGHLASRVLPRWAACPTIHCFTACATWSSTVGPIRVELVEHNPAWSREFSSHAERIRDALGAAARRVEHIGSTAVPGLAAKPIIDMFLVVDDPADEASYIPHLEVADYELRVGEAAINPLGCLTLQARLLM